MAKKLLNEAQVRRFAKLANLRPINEMNSMYEDETEMDAPMDDVAMDAEMEGGADLDAEIEDEMGDDLGSREDMVSKVVMAVADALDVEVAIEGGEEGEELEDAEMEGEVEAELGAPEEAGMEEEPMEDMLAEALKGIKYVPGKKEIVNEVAKRVAHRLLKAKRADAKLQEALGNKRSVRTRTRRQKK